MELHYPALGLTAVLTVALTLWRPAWALGVLLAALPFFTRHPSTAAATGFIAIVAVFQCAWLLRRRPAPGAAFDAIRHTPLLATVAAFAVAAVASLPALPLAGLWAETSTAFAFTGPRGWPGLIEQFVRHVEFRREFPLTATALTLQAAALAFMVFRETREAPSRGRGFALAIAGGAALSVLLGAFELARLIDLTPLRGVAGVYFRPGTMQATAGNPGWFTEFVAYALPYGLVLLGRDPLAPGRRLAFAAYASACAIALLLGYQRGGWITGLVLGGWLAWAVRGVRAHLHPTGRRARAGVLVAVVALGALGLGAAALRRSQSPVDGIDYNARLRTILSGDRLAYWQAAVRIWTRHPVLGGGHESFAYHYQRDFGPGGVFHDAGVQVPDAASAHSLYMQTLSGTGAVGLAVLLMLLGVGAITGWRARVVPALDPDRRVVALGAAGSLLAVAVYGFAQEVFYVHALRLLFFAGVGLLAGAAGHLVTWPPAAARGLFAALALAGFVHAGYEGVWASPERLLAPGTASGLFEEESNAGHEAIRWSSEEAAVPIPDRAAGVDVDVRSAAPMPQHARLEACGRQAAVHLVDAEWHRLSLDLTGCAAGTHVRLRVVPSWRPPGDARLLGVMTRPAVFR